MIRLTFPIQLKLDTFSPWLLLIENSGSASPACRPAISCDLSSMVHEEKKE